MRGSSLGLASMATVAVLGGTAAAFGWSVRPPVSVHRPSKSKSTYLHSSPTSQEPDQAKEQQQQLDHPHSKLWHTTLESSPNSHVNPAVELVLRPPSQGGTGILAIDDVPSDTVAMSLSLEEVGMIDAASILDAYNAEKEGGGDAVFDKLKEMWSKELEASVSNKQNSEEGKRLAVLAGVIAHLQLTRYKDLNSWTANAVKEGNALDESRRLGLFLDAMPLLPQPKSDNPQQQSQHPFPTHFLYWTDDEVQHLLKGTMGQTKAREVRAGIGLVVREWSDAFLKEHKNGATQTQILNAIFSAFSAVLSRSFGDAAGRDVEGKGRMLVPLVDMLNHDGEDPNVKWTWHVGEGDDEKIAEGKGDIVVSTIREVQKGEELVKCYGWRPAWDIASSYGFVPALKEERWECAAVPLFPAVLDLAPESVPTPSQVGSGETVLDLTLETNYGALVKAVLAAVNAANEVKARQTVDDDGEEEDEDDAEKSDRPDQLDRLEVVSLFRPPPTITAEEFPFPRRQPCVVVGTKIRADGVNEECNRLAIESALPAFRAAASAVAQLRNNHKVSSDDSASPIEASKMAMAAASLDTTTNWDEAALELMKNGMDDRLRTLASDGTTAAAWLAKQNDAAGSEDEAKEYRQFRAGVAGDVRDAEVRVLRALRKMAEEW